MGKVSAYKSVILLIAILGLLMEFPPYGMAAVAPVGQLPMVTVSITPSIYALPILVVEKAGEWMDFGIQVKVKVHPHGEEQLDRSVANEWEVAVMDPLSAVKGGNEGNVAIVGIAGDFANQVSFLTSRSGVPPQSGKWAEWLKGYMARTESKGEKQFLPACLVATSSYADTRKTLVIRWLEGYSRGIQIIKKNSEAAASQLKEFYVIRGQSRNSGILPFLPPCSPITRSKGLTLWVHSASRTWVISSTESPGEGPCLRPHHWETPRLYPGLRELSWCLPETAPRICPGHRP